MIEIILLILGVVAHFLKKLMEWRQTTGEIDPRLYFLEQPYRIVWTALLAIGAGVALYSMGELTPITALATGFCADSVAGMLKQRSA